MDASVQGFEDVLYQEQHGQHRVITSVSRALKPSELNYPAHKLEFLALKRPGNYLHGHKFLVLTDNNPLAYILTSAKPDATSHRWLAELLSYDFSIKYISGKNNTDADALSRRHKKSAQEEKGSHGRSS